MHAFTGFKVPSSFKKNLSRFNILLCDWSLRLVWIHEMKDGTGLWINVQLFHWSTIFKTSHSLVLSSVFKSTLDMGRSMHGSGRVGLNRVGQTVSPTNDWQNKEAVREL